jgi:hypothetical protein
MRTFNDYMRRAQHAARQERKAMFAYWNVDTPSARTTAWRQATWWGDVATCYHSLAAKEACLSMGYARADQHARRIA